MQDAHCEVPSDWLDAGENDLYVPTVRDGFMREVVIHFEADTPSSSATRSHPARSVYYHYFTKNSKGPTVWRVALLRAPANPDDADAEETVQGTLTLTVEDFLRSKLNIKQDKLLPSDFMFPDVEADGPGVLPAAIPANALASGQSQAAQFPLTGGALKCCDCERWHNVPEKVMNEVRCPSSDAVGAMLYGGVMPLTFTVAD